MNKTTRTYSLLIGMGLIAGVLGGLFGIGGGAIIVPGLAFFLAFPQRQAHGTSLVAALLFSAAGVVAYAFAGQMDVTLAAELALGAVLGALIGGRFVGLLKIRPLRLVFGLLLAAIAVEMFMSRYAPGQVHSQIAPLIAIGTGILAGFLSAMLGIGGGLVMIPAMVILLGVPQKMAQGVALATVVPTALVGVLIGRSVGNVDLRVGSIVGLGAVTGVAIGSRIALALSDSILKIGFAVVLVLVAILMAMKKKS